MKNKIFCPVCTHRWEEKCYGYFGQGIANLLKFLVVIFFVFFIGILIYKSWDQEYRIKEVKINIAKDSLNTKNDIKLTLNKIEL